MQSTKPRLLLAEDHQELLSELARLLADDFEIVGTVRDGLTLLQVAASLKPDVVVTDYVMPGMDGIEAGRTLLQSGACKAVVLVTLFHDASIASAASQAGIQGCVAKLHAVEDLVPTVKAALGH